MTIYEFYTTYVLTGKARLLTATSLRTLETYLNASALCVQYPSLAGSSSFEIPYNNSISSLSQYGIKIFLIVDPIYITASTLTGVISIPVPEPDDLPF